MTFTYDGADLGITIKKYNRNGNFYRIEYFDGSTSSYLCSDEKEVERIENIMKDQAIDRQNAMDVDKMIRTRRGNLAGVSLTFLSSSFFYNCDNFALSALTIVGAAICLEKVKTETSKILELKKYKLFLEMDKNLSRVNQSRLLSIIEPDHIYQIPLTINHVDDYSYRQMKVLYKKMNETKSD